MKIIFWQRHLQGTTIENKMLMTNQFLNTGGRVLTNKETGKFWEYTRLSVTFYYYKGNRIFIFSIFFLYYSGPTNLQKPVISTSFFFFFFKLSVLLIFFSNLGLSGATACQLLEKSESMRVPGLHIKILCSKHNETNQIGKLKDWIVSMFTRFFLRSSHAHSLGNFFIRQIRYFLFVSHYIRKELCT